jgi:hypothetical protein
VLNNGIDSVGGLLKIQETCMPRGEFKHRYWFFADSPNAAWIVSVILKDYYGEPIFTDCSNNGEDVQYRCFN